MLLASKYTKIIINKIFKLPKSVREGGWTTLRKQEKLLNGNLTRSPQGFRLVKSNF